MELLIYYMTTISRNTSEIKRWTLKKEEFLDNIYGKKTAERKEYNNITNGNLKNINHFKVTLKTPNFSIEL